MKKAIHLWLILHGLGIGIVIPYKIQKQRDNLVSPGMLYHALVKLYFPLYIHYSIILCTNPHIY